MILPDQSSVHVFRAPYKITVLALNNLCWMKMCYKTTQWLVHSNGSSNIKQPIPDT